MVKGKLNIRHTTILGEPLLWRWMIEVPGATVNCLIGRAVHATAKLEAMQVAMSLGITIEEEENSNG